jgi:hypothetical protein
MMLFMTLMTVGSALSLSSKASVLIMMIVPPIHMCRQLRGAYLIGRISAALRTVALVMMSGIALLLYLVILLAMGVFH